jgi:hypothetical protein
MRLALYQPDIPQNTGTIMRLAACFGVPLDIIEPCGFVLSDTKLRRAGMDYAARVDMVRHASWERFQEREAPGRLTRCCWAPNRQGCRRMFTRRWTRRSGCRCAPASVRSMSRSARESRSGKGCAKPMGSWMGATEGVRKGLSIRGRPTQPWCETTAGWLSSRLRRRLQRLVEIGDDIVDMLDPDRETDIAVRHAGRELVFRRKLAVRGAGRMDRQGARVTDIRYVIE